MHALFACWQNLGLVRWVAGNSGSNGQPHTSLGPTWEGGEREGGIEREGGREGGRDREREGGRREGREGGREERNKQVNERERESEWREIL